MAAMQRVFSEIEFSKTQGVTVVTKNYCIPPLKIINTASHSSASFCFLTNYGAGFVEGDAVALQLKAGKNTQSVITTQGNTRVYKSEGKIASQTIEASLDDNAFHVFLNDPLVMHDQGAFIQKSHWLLKESSVLLFVDWFSAGRVKNQEAFNFQSYQSETKASIEGRLIIWDKFHINPTQDDIRSPGCFHDNTTYLNIFLIGNENDPRVKLLESHLNLTGQKFLHKGHLVAVSSDKPVVGSTLRLNKQGYLSRYTSFDVHHLQRVLTEVVRVLEDESLLGFNPLRNRFNLSDSPN